MKKCFVFFVALGLFSCCFARSSIVDEIAESARDNWRKISEKCQDARELAEDLPNLPDSAWFSTDKKDQLKKIRKMLDMN